MRRASPAISTWGGGSPVLLSGSPVVVLVVLEVASELAALVVGDGVVVSVVSVEPVEPVALVGLPLASPVAWPLPLLSPPQAAARSRRVSGVRREACTGRGSRGSAPDRKP
jgi:hypothetical protein